MGYAIFIQQMKTNQAYQNVLLNFSNHELPDTWPTNKLRYIDKLQSFADSYNQTHHRTIDTEPINVTKQNEESVRLSTYFSKPHTEKSHSWKFRFNIGDHVRITHLRNVFTREYDQRWTGEVFTISKRFWRSGVPIYKIKDYHDEEIKGTFYQSELQKINIKENEL